MPRDFWSFGDEDRVGRLLSPSFSPASSDRTGVAAEDYKARIDRKRLQEQLQREFDGKNPLIASAPKKSGLLTRGFLEPATGLVEPEGRTFSERTERQLSSLPGFNRPSRLLGAPVEALADVVSGVEGPAKRLLGPSKDVVADLEARLLDPDYGKKARKPLKPGDFLYAGPVAKKPDVPTLAAVDRGLELTPAQAMGIAGEAFVPTPADVAAKAGGYVLNPALMGGLALVGGLKNIGKSAAEARKAAKLIDAAKAIKKQAMFERSSESLVDAVKQWHKGEVPLDIDEYEKVVAELEYRGLAYDEALRPPDSFQDVYNQANKRRFMGERGIGEPDAPPVKQVPEPVESILLDDIKSIEPPRVVPVRSRKRAISGPIDELMEARRTAELEHIPERVLGEMRQEPIFHASPEGVADIGVGTRYVPGRDLAKELPKPTLTRPIEEVGPGTLARRAAMRKEVEEAPKQIGYRPTGREFIGKGKTGVEDAFRPATNRIREMGGMTGTPREVANGIAAMFDNGTRLMRQYLNETVVSGKPIMKGIDGLTEEQAKAFARSADLLQYSGDPKVDAVLKPYYARREAQRVALTKLGVEVPGKTGLPHIDLEGTNIALLANTDDVKARRAILEKWATHAPDVKLSDSDVETILKTYQGMGAELMPKEKLTKFLPNITEARGLNAPGHLADPNSPKFTKARLKETIKLYDKQYAFGKADAEQFGPNAEKFMALMEKAPNPVFREIVGAHREHYVGGAFGKTPGARLARDAANEIRAVRTGALLGQSWLPQMLEWAPRVLPKSMSVIGMTKGAGVMAGAIKEFWSDPRKAAEMARAVGALSDQYALEVTGARSLFERGAAKTQAIPEIVLGKLTPFELLNVHSYALGTAAGKLHLEQLGDAITKSNPQSHRAEEFIRKIMPANPDEAQRLINSAKSGRSLLEPGDELATKARDIYAYNFAMSALGDAGPNVTPIAASTDLGRLAFHLKNFDYQYTRTILDFVDEFKKGNPAPLLTWATAAAPLSGYGTRIARMAAAGDMDGIRESLEDEGFIEGLILNHSAAGGFGLASSTLSGIAGVASGDAWDMARGTGQLLGPELGLPLEAAVRIKDQGPAKALSRMFVPNPLGARTWAERGVEYLNEGESEPPMNARDFTPEWLRDQDWYTTRLQDLGGRRMPMPQTMPALGDTSDIWSF